MSKILLLGYPPPMLDRNTKTEAANYRTWQFLQPLLEDGHQIYLCMHSEKKTCDLTIPDNWQDQITCGTIAFQKLGWSMKLQRIHKAFDPDCIVAVNFDVCLYATKLRTGKPIWMDIYGDYLTIVQAARYRAQSSRGIPTSIAFVQQVLQKGDVFSVCSSTQGHALVGELAMAGRLNHMTFGYEFTKLVLPGACMDPCGVDCQVDQELRTKSGISSGDFVILWCGGYNTWTDVDTLFAGLESAMANNIAIKFISVGANTYDAPDNVYSRFLRKISESPYCDRFRMLGWRPWGEISDYYRISDLGINIDALHYETIYGTRTRLLEMIAAGLPVATSLGSELSYLLKERGAALTFDVGNSKQLGDLLLMVSKDKNLAVNMREKAQACAAESLSFAMTTEPLRKWVIEPIHAPDKLSNGFQYQLRSLEYHARADFRQVLWKVLGLDR